MMPLVVRIEDLQTGAVTSSAFIKSPVRIGRSELNDLPLPQGFVSQWHAVVQFDDAEIRYVDLGSTNGSVIGGARIERNVPVQVAGDTEIRIGALKLTFSRRATGERRAPQPTIFAMRAATAMRPAVAPAPIPLVKGAPVAAGAPAGEAAVSAAPPSVARPAAGPGPAAAPAAPLPSPPAEAPPPPSAVLPSPVAAPAPFGATLSEGTPLPFVAPPPAAAPPPPVAAPPPAAPAPSAVAAPPAAAPPPHAPAPQVGAPPPAPSFPVLDLPTGFRMPAVTQPPQAPPTYAPAPHAPPSHAPHAPPPQAPAPQAPQAKLDLPTEFRPAVPAPPGAAPSGPAGSPAPHQPAPAWSPAAAPPLAPASPPAPAAPQSAFGPSEVDRLFATFAESYLPATAMIRGPDDAQAFLGKLAEALEAFARAFVEMRKGYEEFGRQMGIRTIHGDGPVQRARDPRQVIAALLDPGQQGRSSELQASFADYMVHQVALLNGVVEGAKAILARLSPEQIEAGAPQSLWPMKAQALWKSFDERFRELVEDDGAISDALFGREFGKAYTSIVGGRGGAQQDDDDDDDDDRDDDGDEDEPPRRRAKKGPRRRGR